MPHTETQVVVVPLGSVDLASYCGCPDPCDSCCGVMIDCCDPPVNVPSTLHGTFTCSSACPETPGLCFDGAEFTFTYQMLSGGVLTGMGWRGTVVRGECSPDTFTIEFQCQDNGDDTFSWKIDWGTPATGFSIHTCNPTFLYTHYEVGPDDSCFPLIETITITE